MSSSYPWLFVCMAPCTSTHRNTPYQLQCAHAYSILVPMFAFYFSSKPRDSIKLCLSVCTCRTPFAFPHDKMYNIFYRQMDHRCKWRFYLLFSLLFNWSEHWPIQWFTLFTWRANFGLGIRSLMYHDKFMAVPRLTRFLIKVYKLIKVNAFINWWQNSRKIGVLFVSISIEYLICSFA